MTGAAWWWAAAAEQSPNRHPATNTIPAAEPILACHCMRYQECDVCRDEPTADELAAVVDQLAGTADALDFDRLGR